MTKSQKTPTPKLVAIVDRGGIRGLIAKNRFDIEADSSSPPGLRIVIASFQYKPHAEMFVRAFKSYDVLKKSVESLHRDHWFGRRKQDHDYLCAICPALAKVGEVRF